MRNFETRAFGWCGSVARASGERGRIFAGPQQVALRDL